MGGRRGRLYRVDLHYERSICITMGRVNIVLHTPFCEGAGQIIYVCVVSVGVGNMSWRSIDAKRIWSRIMEKKLCDI